jgi:ABC-type Fe3+/spermidine/putrescine transport system ATPase subunit
MIRLSQIRLSAGGFTLGPVDLEAPAGSYTVLFGPSGAGKTILLEAVAGLHPVDAGTVELGGRDVSALPPEARGIGLVFQDALLFPHRTVRDNIRFGLGARTVPGLLRPRPRHGDPVGPAAAATGVTHLLDRRPQTLSGGERQRVALARALVTGPAVLLLDEPLGALDGDAREALQRVLKALASERGVTVLHVTHDLVEACALADTCAVLVSGTIRQVGAPLDVLTRPVDAAVARLVGARNVLRARICGDRSISLAPDVGRGAGALADQELVTVVIRPEDVLVGGEAPPGAALWHGVVEAVTYQGASSLVRVHLPPAVDALMPSRRVVELGLQVGVEVAVALPEASLHVLDAPLLTVPPI